MDELQKLYAGYRDEYAIEQLRVEFLTASTPGRIDLLEGLQRSHFGVPSEIYQLAAEDSDSRVRAWCARHCMADLEPSLRDHLILDPDPLVRAKGVKGGYGAYRKFTVSNEFPSGVWEIEDFPWQSASEIERLARLRNPQPGSRELFLKLFNPNDQELGLTPRDRRRYCLAFIAAHPDGPPLVSFINDEIAELTPLWPKDAGIQAFVYRYCELGKFADVVYQHCNEPLWRAYMLENVLWRNGDVSDRLLELACKDENCGIRELAHMGMDRGWSVERTLERAIDDAIAAKDEAALRGLARNPKLYVEELEKVRDHSPEFIKDWARKTIAEKQRSHVFEQLRGRQQINPKSRGLDQQAQLRIKIDHAVNGIEFLLAFIDDVFDVFWVSITLGMLLAGLMYFFTRDAGWTIVVLTVGLWVGVSVGMLWFHKLRQRSWDYGYALGPLDYSDPESDWRAEFDRKFGEAEYKEVSRLRSLVWQISRKTDAVISTNAQDTRNHTDRETQRIERYKAALAAAKAQAEVKEYEEEKEEQRKAYQKRREEILKRRNEVREKRRSKARSKSQPAR